MSREWGIGVGALLGVMLAAAMAVAASKSIAYVYGWGVTTVSGERAVWPPLTLLWERSPIWFERWKPGGLSESPSRRLAEGPDGFVTVLRRKLYGLDRRTGRTQWTLPLQGAEVFDWKVDGDTFVYASYGNDEQQERYWGIRAAIDLRERKEIWAKTRPIPYLRHEWLGAHERMAIFGDDRSNEVIALALGDGTERWRVPQSRGDDYPVQATWFTYDDILYALAGRKSQGGLFLKSFDLATGRELPLVHLFGHDAQSNLFVPSAMTVNGRLFVGYRALRERKSSVIGYDLKEKRSLWETKVLHGTESKNHEVLSCRSIVLSDAPEQPLVALYDPNRWLVLDPATGAVLKDVLLPDYIGWAVHSAVLYSYPYVFTGARRAVGPGMVYDLIALNVETGKVEWSYDIERQNRHFTTPSAEILNFLVQDREIYVSRTDARVMAFRASVASAPAR